MSPLPTHASRNRTMTNSTSSSKRLVKNAEVDSTLIHKTLQLLKLNPSADITIPENGRIASNICVDTHEMGMVMLRFYPKDYHEEKLETGSVDFEIETLYYLSSNGIPVPKPLLFSSSEYKIEENGIKIFAYQLIDGETLRITDLSNSIATKSGVFLRDMIQISQNYQPANLAPEGDLEFFLEIYKKLLAKYPELKKSIELKKMAVFTETVHKQGDLYKTPKGIVHADFFFENIVVKQDGTLSAIDFGDAYYGHVLMDIVIGSMEFCVLENAEWDIEFFKSFLTPNCEWLSTNNVSSELFYSLLAANCLRFAVYTMPHTIEDEQEVKENPYIHRFYQLMESELKSQIECAYSSVVK